MRIWTNECRLLNTIEFPSGVVALAYCHDAQLLWLASSYPYPSLIDPRSGENVTDCSAAFLTWQAGAQRHSRFEQLRYFREQQTMLAVCDNHDVLLFKYSASAASLCFRAGDASTAPLECLAATEKAPNFILFTGDSDGQIRKWEKASSTSHKLHSAALDVASAARRAARYDIHRFTPVRDARAIAVPSSLDTDIDAETLRLPSVAETTKQRRNWRAQNPLQKSWFWQL